MVWHLDDPIGDPITQPNFELARRVRQDVRWVFNGEGGDPVFGGPKNIPMMLQHWYGVSREHNFREKAYLASYRRAYDECTRVLHENDGARRSLGIAIWSPCLPPSSTTRRCNHS